MLSKRTPGHWRIFLFRFTRTLFSCIPENVSTVSYSYNEYQEHCTSNLNKTGNNRIHISSSNLIRLLSRWLMNVSVSLHLLRHFKLRSDTSSWDPRICPRMGHSSPRLWTSYYWPTVSQTLLISCKLVSLEEKHQWYFITVNPKCPGLRIKNSSSDGQRMIYVNGGYI